MSEGRDGQAGMAAGCREACAATFRWLATGNARGGRTSENARGKREYTSRENAVRRMCKHRAAGRRILRAENGLRAPRAVDAGFERDRRARRGVRDCGPETGSIKRPASGRWANFLPSRTGSDPRETTTAARENMCTPPLASR